MSTFTIGTTNLPAALTPGRLLMALGMFALAVAAVLLFGTGRPGDALPQWAAAVGAVLLLVPAVFSWHKRIAGASRPRFWFVAHVLCSLLGGVFIAFHLRGGDLVSPPGVVAIALIFLVVQGVLARALLGRQYAQLFARAPAAFSPRGVDRQVLAQLIAEKVALLSRLDPSADEAVFSLLWRHWIASPALSWKFAALARRERALVGAASMVSPVLRFWRLLHLLAALVFITGLLAHVVVVLFFAGYAAGDQTPYWWYVFAWGGSQ